MKQSLYNECKEFIKTNGADLFGVADIHDIKNEFNLAPELLDEVGKAICIGVRLSSAVFTDIKDAPTKLYFHHYKTANFFLDQLAFRVTGWLERHDALAIPIAASQIIDWQKQTAFVSHKKLGVAAGLGWIGRNNLLVNRELGSQFRLASILTNADIKVDKQTGEDCGACHACVKSCPVHAIKETPGEFDHQLCFQKLKEFQKSGVVGQYICGICVGVCKPGK